MRVKTIALKNNIASLKNCLNECERIVFEVFRNINDLNNYWKDSYTTAFFDAMNKEQSLSGDLIQSIKKLRKVYIFVYDEYSGYGRSFEMDTSLKDTTLKSFDNYIDNIDKILKIYKSIPINEFKDEAEMLEKNKESFNNNKKEVLSMKNTVRKLYESVDSVELEVARKLKDIDITPIEVCEFQNLEAINITSGKVGISSEALEILDRIEALANDQSENLNKFNNAFKELLVSYDSANNEKIEEIELDISNSFNNFINNNRNLIIYVKSRYKEFEQADKNVKKITEDFINQQH